MWQKCKFAVIIEYVVTIGDSRENFHKVSTLMKGFINDYASVSDSKWSNSYELVLFNESVMIYETVLNQLIVYGWLSHWTVSNFF